MMLYKWVELVEGEPVLFVGVHILRWRFDEWGEPTAAFVEAEPDDKDATIAQLRADLVAMTKQRNTLLEAARGLVTIEIKPDLLGWAWESLSYTTCDPPDNLAKLDKAYGTMLNALLFCEGKAAIDAPKEAER